MHDDRAMPANQAALIGSREACQVLAVDKSTLSRWVASGKLTPALRLPTANGAFLFQRKDIEALAKETAA